jgi:Fe-S cluster biogenesis protein NfuA
MSGTTPEDERRELSECVQKVLDEFVRPGLKLDGGDVELVGIDSDRIVQVRLAGTCSGCPSTVYTLTMGMESEVKARVPEIRFLEAVL